MTEVADLTVAELASAYRASTLSPVEVARTYLDRIERHDGEVNAFCLVDQATTLDEAQRAQDRFAKDEPLGEFDGIPVAVKDLLVTRGWATRRGSMTIPPEGPWPDDAPAIVRLRRAGAVLLGKTTTPEYGWKGITDSALSGVTVNPWDPSLSAGGSSGGSAAAVALRMAPVAIGTDGGGSIRIPAALCGVFGVKPTFGTVANWPPSAFGFVAHVGPMAGTVDDARRLLIAMAGPDSRDPSALADPLSERPGLDLRTLRIGFSADLGHVQVIEPEVLTHVERAVATMAGLGIDVRPVGSGLTDPITAFHYYWFTGAARLVQTIPVEQRSLMDPGLLEIAAAGAAYTSDDASAARLELGRLKARVERLFESIDVLITPSLPITSLPACAEVPPGWPEPRWTSWTPFTYPFNLTGNPAASINVGWTDNGLPVGAQLVGRHGEDLVILDLAQAIEEMLAPYLASRAPARSHASPDGAR